MFHRTLIGAALVGLVGLPYVLSTPNGQPSTPDASLPEALVAAVPPVAEVPPRLPAVPRGAGGPNHPGHRVQSAPRPAPPTRLEDIFRFDLTAEQVMHTWPTVTTATNQPELKGYRVPLVTGQQPESLAGSLTYYFAADQRLQRIVFHGTTGDPKPVVALVTQKFEFKPDPAPDASIQRYVVRWSGKVVSELRVQPAPVVDAREPHRRLLINLLIERPQKLRWFTGGGSGLELRL
jgi:hypothetical protein